MNDIELHRWYGAKFGDSISMFWISMMDEEKATVISCEFAHDDIDAEYKVWPAREENMGNIRSALRMMFDITDWFWCPLPVPDTHTLDFVRVTAPHFFEAKNA